MYNHLLDTFLAVCDCKKFYESGKTALYFTDRGHEADQPARKGTGFKADRAAPTPV